MSTATNVTVLMKKAGAMPTPAMSRPAAPGPSSRAKLNDAEFSPTALGMSSLPTISETNACRAGLSAAVITPNTNASRYIRYRCIEPVAVSTPISSDTAAMDTWVTISTLRLS